MVPGARVAELLADHTLSASTLIWTRAGSKEFFWALLAPNCVDMCCFARSEAGGGRPSASSPSRGSAAYFVVYLQSLDCNGVVSAPALVESLAECSG
jgi:hypothetical protein